MSDSAKATRATVAIGTLEVDGFMLPDGSYRMSQTQAAECVGLTERNAREFLESNAFKRLMGEEYTPAILEIESETQSRGQSRFRALPLEVVVIYWVWQCHRGNKEALNLLVALATETLERRFDRAFQVARSEDDYDSRLESRRLGEIAQGLYDELQQADDWFLRTNTRIRKLERLLLQHGINPMTANENEGDDRHE